MKRYIVSLLLVLSIALPVMAQDETPVATETVAPEPTLAPTPAPEPEPSPIDETAIPEQVWVLLGAAILGIVVVAFAGIVAAYKGLPAPAQAVIMSVLKSIATEFDKKSAETENKVDDAISVEFKKRIELLEAALRANGIAAPPEPNTFTAGIPPVHAIR